MRGAQSVGLLDQCGVCEPRRCAKTPRRNRDGLRRGRISQVRCQLTVTADVLGPRQAYPNAAFTAAVYGEHRQKFGTPEITLHGKRICATGQISDYQGKPEIVSTDPSQLTE